MDGDHAERDLFGVVGHSLTEDDAVDTAAGGQPSLLDPHGDLRHPVAVDPPAPPSPPVRFRPSSQDDLAPAGSGAKVAANLTALRTLSALQAEGRTPTSQEQAVLARWAGWGAAPEIFDPRQSRYEHARDELRTLLDEAAYRAAERTTLNAHYTDASFVTAIWDALSAHGFDETAGRVLEPGCGVGTFLGLAPPTACELTGIELDPTTAAIASVLYPHAVVRAESFADTPLREGSVDLAIGNVPFASSVLHDKRHNPNRHSLHNHFIIKALHLTRPGGVVAVLTSHWSLDAVNPAARREIAELADLVSAIRLPASAHERAAGTRVITDLLVLRRHAEDDRGIYGSEWEQASRIGGDEERPVSLNDYFAAHPEHVLGQLSTRSGQFGPEIDVIHPGTVADIAAELRERLEQDLGDYRRLRPLFTVSPAASMVPARAVPLADAPADALEGHLHRAGEGTFVVRLDGDWEPHSAPASQRRELGELLGLRDTVLALLAAEAASVDDTDQIADLRADLNTRYDAYLARYGPINRVSLRRTGRTDPDTGQERLARIRPPQGGFRSDPHSPAVYALEHYDPADGTAIKATLFAERAIAPRPRRLGADTADDALAICLDTHGRVELPEIARLLGTDESTARARLGTLVFNDPTDPQRLIAAAEYLSGDVRAKLRAAQAAADHDTTDLKPESSAGSISPGPAGATARPATETAAQQPAPGSQWQPNIDALTAVLPADLGPDEITVRLGASWIGASDIAAFLTELLDDASIQVEHPGGSTWTVKGNHHSVLATSTHGTGRVSAVHLAQAVLEQRPIKVFDEPEPGMRVLNLTETVAAAEKATELNDHFTEWIWSDPERTRRLTEVYNTTFNSIVLRSYDGTARQFPGLAITLTLREHQVAAVVRILSEPAVLLGHEVGAGKTLEMIVACMEMRRLGLATKPAVVVPNHMLAQFSREWLQAYPQARVLAAGSEDLTRDKRRLFQARVATGDWDAVIMSRTAFERLPLSPQRQQAYYEQELTALRAKLDASQAAGGLTVKRLQATLQRAEERLKKTADTLKDPGISFEDSGIDYVLIDEAHGYKNLHTESAIPGAGIDGSGRAADLDMKLSYLRERHGDRVATFATATPVANSVAEAYVMQRFLRPDLLDAAGLTDFDSWAATFGEVVTDLELAPDGSRYRMQSRFARFRNVPELLRMWFMSADIKTADDLDLPTPAIAGGAAQTVVVEPSPQLKTFMAALSARADRVQSRGVDPAEDNMLRVATHGRMAALDLRLLPAAVLREAGLVSGTVDGPVLLDVAADRIAAIYHRHADTRYAGHPTPGALQLAFCDLGTPTGSGWNAYDELRALLTARGVPDHQIAYMHQARNDREKGELFAAARTGRIAVLLGSTEKMGVGTNVQTRLVALHHIDCPWRPADLAQRDGRAMRQGNLNAEVELLRYVTRESFAAYSWQTVERKARFINQIMRGRLDMREIEDIGDTALSYAECKALASGDPRVLDKAHADSEATRLERLHRAWTRSHHTLQATVDIADQRLPMLTAQHEQITSAIIRHRDTRGDRFAITVNGTTITDRADAAITLRRTLTPLLPTGHDTPTTVIGHLAGFDILAHGQRLPEPAIRLELADVPRSAFTISPEELRPDRPLGLITRIENRAHAITTTRSEIEHDIERLRNERDRATTDLTQPFPHAEALTNARRRAEELAAAIAADALATPTNTTSTTDTSDTPTDASTTVTDRADAAAQPQEPAPPTTRAPGSDPPLSAAPPAPSAAASATAAPPPHPPPAQPLAPGPPSPLATQGLPASHHPNGLPPANPTLNTPGSAPAADTPTQHAPPGGGTDRDGVVAAQADHAPWPAAQHYPIGTALTVHAIAAQGSGSRLGHGIVIDHPTPEHVTVESPFGTRRVAPITHVSTTHTTMPAAQPADSRTSAPGIPGAAPHPGHATATHLISQPCTAPTTSAAAETDWANLLRHLPCGERITTDDTWPQLADTLAAAAAQAQTYDLGQRLPELAARLDPDDPHPATELRYQLLADCAELAKTGQPASGTAVGGSAHITRPHPHEAISRTIAPRADAPGPPR